MRETTVAPPLTVLANGVPLAEEHLRALAGVRVRGQLSLPAQCELVFGAPPGPLPAAELAPGMQLRVLVGGWQTPLFDGEITVAEFGFAADGSQTLHARGYDRLARLRKRRPLRAHVQAGLRDLAEELTRDLGLRVEGDDAGVLWRHLLQHGQSDLDLLADLAAQSGRYLALRGGTLHLCTLEGLGEAVSLQWGESLHEAQVEVSAEPALRTTGAHCWDPLRVEAREGRATHGQTGRTASAAAEPGAVGGSGRASLTGGVALNDRHAEALAQAELNRHAAREVVLRGIAAGNPDLQPGVRVEVGGLSPALDGRYVLASVLHTIDAQNGFTSEISSAPPPPAPAPPPSVAALGIVSNAADPEQLGRVRVTLPAYGGLETDWMHVLSAGAGAGKGLMIVPDTDDTVLVLMAGADPAQGIVLGGLYGMQGMPDSGIVGPAQRRFTLLTPGNQRVVLDDAERRIHLEDSQGSYVELSPGVFRLHAAVDLEIEAPGRSILIRGQAIDFERG